MLLTGGISGIWSQTEGSGYASSVISEYEGGRARLHLGARHASANGTIFSAEITYDGIGSDGYESVGLALGLDMKF
jgi:hypothetical protein